MYEQIIKQLWCFIVGHRWNWVDAYNEPDIGATCYRCGKVNDRRY